MDDLERLKELAEKATPGKRVRRDNADYAEVTQNGVMQAMVGTAEDADFLCATDPEAVLKLIARVRELESNQIPPGCVARCSLCGQAPTADCEGKWFGTSVEGEGHPCPVRVLKQ